MAEDDNPFPINEKEVMEYYGYSGRSGSFKLKTKFLRSWILHSLAYSTHSSGFAVKIQKISDLTKQNEIKYPKMKDSTREILINFFKPHNEKLFGMLGRRFNWNE